MNDTASICSISRPIGWLSVRRRRSSWTTLRSL